MSYPLPADRIFVPLLYPSAGISNQQCKTVFTTEIRPLSFLNPKCCNFPEERHKSAKIGTAYKLTKIPHSNKGVYTLPAQTNILVVNKPGVFTSS